MMFEEPSTGLLYEGEDWIELYKKNPDPMFVSDNLRIKEYELPFFHGKVSLSFWLKSLIPLPSIPITFCGSPITDLFPLIKWPSNDNDGADIIKTLVQRAVQNNSLAIVIKDLPLGDPLEKSLIEEGFIPINHDPVWYTPVYSDLQIFLNTLSKGRRRGLEGRWKRFNQCVKVRPAVLDDLKFIKKGYDTVWQRSGMRLEKLTEGFFKEAILHPSSNIFIFEKDKMPFGFVMLWQKDNVWFDKYMGTDDSIYRDVSFYSMSMLYLLKIAPSYGVNLYVAGQGCGIEKEGLGFKRIDVKLWIRPLLSRFILLPALKWFIRAHNKRIYKN